MRNRKTQTIRLFLLFEAASFIAASLVHAGVLITGYEHQKARIAESVLAISSLPNRQTPKLACP